MPRVVAAVNRYAAGDHEHLIALSGVRCQVSGVRCGLSGAPALLIILHRYDYRQAKHAEFHALWSRHVALHLDNPFAGASSPELETYATASES